MSNGNKSVPNSPRKVWCIVVAGGSGARFGAPKQFLELRGERVIDRSVRTANGACDATVVVVPLAEVESERARQRGVHAVVAGGASRSESVRAGLSAVPAEAEVILVHDAARPLASAELFDVVRDNVIAGAEAVVPATAVVDTLRRLDGGTVDRDALRAVQTPQGFDAQTLRRAHASASEATDDAALVEALGCAVLIVDGERSNLKVTEPVDLVIAEAFLGESDRESAKNDPTDAVPVETATEQEGST